MAVLGLDIIGGMCNTQQPLDLGPADEIASMKRTIEEQASSIRALQASRIMLQQMIRQFIADSINE